MGNIQDFASGVEYIARQVVESTPRDITQKGRITAVVGTGLYSVLINGKTYASVPTYPSGSTSLAVNDIVWCMAPQGNYAQIFILTGGSGSAPTPGTTDYNALTNKPSINSVTLSGNKTLSQLGIQPAGNYVVDADYVHTDNNFTDTDNTKLQGIQSGAEVNIIETVQVNGSALTPTNKTVNVTVPTKTSDITNDSAFQTATQVTSSISTHNTSTSAHGDIRTAISDETSNRQTADNGLQSQITSNDTDIANLQTGKANVSDVPTKTSDLTNDSGFLASIPSEYVTETEMQAYAQPIGDYAISTQLSTETTNRQTADTNLQTQINTLQAKSDVVDIVGTYQALLNYDVSTLHENDIIKVLDDSTHNNNRTYYRYTVSPVWTYIGEEVDVGTVVTVGGTEQSTWNADVKADVSSLANVATSGLYSDLTGTPTSLPASDVYSWAKQPTKPTYTSSEVGLGNVPNVTTNNQTPTWTIASALANLVSGEALSTAFGKIAKAIQSLISHIANVSNPHSVTKSQVGLGSVDNTADLNKPISTATQDALNLKADTEDLADVAFSGLYSDLTGQPTIPTNADFDLSGLGDVTITSPTSGQVVQYNGTKWINGTGGGGSGVSSFNGRTGVVTPESGDYTASMVGLGNVNNTSDANKPISTATQNALNLKANLASPVLTGTPIAPTATLGTSTTQIATTAFVADTTANFVSAVEPSTTTTTVPTNADTLGGYPADNYIRQAQVIDVSTSTSATLPLSANQGRIINNAVNTKAPLASPVFTGTPTTSPNTLYTTPQLRNIIYSTVAPTALEGNNGDLWIIYEE